MDLALGPADLAFRDEVRAFLDEHLTPELRAAGRAATSVFIEPRHSLPWQRILHAKGWVAPSWPTDHGGAGVNEMQRYGTDAQKGHYLPRILSGEDYWCQGYSEPFAGSDLASLQLRAEADGDA